MTTIFKVEENILDCKTQAEIFLSQEDYTNLLLDGIISINKGLNIINDCYLKLFKHFDDLSSCKVISDKEIESLKQIILELSKFATQTSILFAKLTKSDIVSTGCKTALNDLRTNIRTLREYLEDIEDTFLLDESEELNSLITNLL
ncbi:MAG: hypothetical protein A2033_11215 [Bacteroidetes bacterium GWA2_31_9]|nr:MAG: hypothetical protein A2033_11215 [Bacteroidetes bacterium GWA2_31_9]